MKRAGRPTQAIIHLDHLRHNVKTLQALLPSGQEMMAIVKANAYGHGSIMVSRAIETCGVKKLGVATFEEGQELRSQGIRSEIYVLDGVMGPLADYFSHRLYPVISQKEQLEDLSQFLGDENREFSAVLKFDTGMGRLGFLAAQVDEVYKILYKTPFLKINCVMTHLARADEGDTPETQRQYTLFKRLRDILEERGLKNAKYSLANSAATLDGRFENFDWVRPGIALYGAYPHERQKSLVNLKPVLELKSQIICLKNLSSHSAIGYGGTFTTTRDSVMAILPIGYADGYPRLVSNRGHVLVRGKLAPIVGRISMDLMTIDVTDIPGVSLGDEVVLIGQDGQNDIRVEQVAAWADTISYEILCGLTSRVPRIYSGS